MWKIDWKDRVWQTTLLIENYYYIFDWKFYGNLEFDWCNSELKVCRKTWVWLMWFMKEVHCSSQLGWEEGSWEKFLNASWSKISRLTDKIFDWNLVENKKLKNKKIGGKN